MAPKVHKPRKFYAPYCVDTFNRWNKLVHGTEVYRTGVEAAIRGSDDGSPVEVHARPNAKILYEKTPEFRALRGHGYNYQYGILNQLRFDETAASVVNDLTKAARSAGWDALSFEMDTLGTHIFNTKAFKIDWGTKTRGTERLHERVKEFLRSV